MTASLEGIQTIRLIAELNSEILGLTRIAAGGGLADDISPDEANERIAALEDHRKKFMAGEVTFRRGLPF